MRHLRVALVSGERLRSAYERSSVASRRVVGGQPLHSSKGKAAPGMVWALHHQAHWVSAATLSHTEQPEQCSEPHVYLWQHTGWWQGTQ